ncbi:MAG: queuosine salvage family protein, partial [Acidobacteriota bacterium]
FMILLEAVNFGSASFGELRHEPGEVSGYFTVARGLTRAFERGEAPSAQRLARLGAAACARLLGQESRPEALPLMARFASSLRSLGEHVEERYGGRFVGLVEAAGGQAPRLVERILEVPSFRDQAEHRGLTVRFFKRAQLLAADLSLALGGRGLGDLRGLDELTIFADDLVPHVLRTDGILRYDPALEARIERGEDLGAGSEEEVEIRAAAVNAAERIVAELRAAGREISPMQLDYCLWNRGLALRYGERPRHRAVTDFY